MNPDYTAPVCTDLKFDLAGLAPSTGYGSLTTPGTVRLNGTLSVRLASGFLPKLGDTFTVMNFGSRVGDFSLCNGLNLLGTGRRLEPVYTANALKLVTVAATNEQPPLRLSRRGNSMVMGWGTEFAGYRLLSATNLITQRITNLDQTIVDKLVLSNWAEWPLNGPNKVLFVPTEAHRFFLLTKP